MSELGRKFIVPKQQFPSAAIGMLAAVRAFGRLGPDCRWISHRQFFCTLHEGLMHSYPWELRAVCYTICPRDFCCEKIEIKLK
jgi:hypothetical protein